MRGGDIHRRADSASICWCHERRQIHFRVSRIASAKAEIGKLHGRELDRRIHGQHRRDHRVVELHVLAWHQAVDVVFVEDPPPGNRILRIRRNKRRPAPLEAAPVVILDEIGAVLRESAQIGGIDGQVPVGIQHAGQIGRHGDLQFRAVIGHAEHRLHDRVQLREVPVARRVSVRLHRHRL